MVSCRAGDAASRIFTALDTQSQQALRESTQALEAAERRAAAAAVLAQEAEQKARRQWPQALSRGDWIPRSNLWR